MITGLRGATIWSEDRWEYEHRGGPKAVEGWVGRALIDPEGNFVQLLGANEPR